MEKMIGFVGFEMISNNDIVSIVRDFASCKIVSNMTKVSENLYNFYIYGEIPTGSEYEDYVDNELWQGDSSYEELKAKYESK